jgi:stress response protein YsnF
LAESVRRVWRYQRGNHNPYIEEEQTTQWPNEDGQKINDQQSIRIKLKIEKLELH